MPKWRGRLREPTATQPWEASDDWAQSVTLPVVAQCIGGLRNAYPTGARTVTLSSWAPQPGTPPGAPRGPGKKFRKFPARGPPGPGPPGGPPGAPRGPLRGPPAGGPIYILFIHKRGPGGAPPGGPPGGAPPGGGKMCTFFWVFNNSPSRDKNWTFFPPRGQGPGRWIGG